MMYKLLFRHLQLHLTHVLLTPGSAALVSDSPFITPPPSPFLQQIEFGSIVRVRNVN